MSVETLFQILSRPQVLGRGRGCVFLGFRILLLLRCLGLRASPSAAWVCGWLRPRSGPAQEWVCTAPPEKGYPPPPVWTHRPCRWGRRWLSSPQGLCSFSARGSWDGEVSGAGKVFTRCLVSGSHPVGLRTKLGMFTVTIRSFPYRHRVARAATWQWGPHCGTERGLRVLVTHCPVLSGRGQGMWTGWFSALPAGRWTQHSPHCELGTRG